MNFVTFDMREVVFDTETTGLDPVTNRIIDIACIEIIDKEPTGRYFQSYLNPCMSMSQESIDITGITNEFLKDKPKFIEVVDELLEFIGKSPLVAHNATFDINFLNEELKRLNYKVLTNKVVDTLEISRRKYTSNHSLNALCKRFKISLSDRTVHGAMIDAKLLVKVYGYLCVDEDVFVFSNDYEEINVNHFPNKNIVQLTEEEEKIHQGFMQNL